MSDTGFSSAEFNVETSSVTLAGIWGVTTLVRTVTLRQFERFVMLNIPDSNATTASGGTFINNVGTPIPLKFRPTNTAIVPIRTDNGDGTSGWGVFKMGSTGEFDILAHNGTWVGTASGGIPGSVITYFLD